MGSSVIFEAVVGADAGVQLRCGVLFFSGNGAIWIF